MSQEVYHKLQKGKSKFLQYLYSEEINRSWFICFHISKNEDEYLPLYLTSWENALDLIINAKDPLPSSFREILYLEILNLLSQQNFSESVESYEKDDEPYIEEEYRLFVKGIEQLPKEERVIYLLSTFGNIRPRQLGIAFKKTENQMKELIAHISFKAQNTPEIRKINGALAVILSTQFKSIGGSIFNKVVVPQFVFSKLDNKLCSMVKKKERHLFKRRSN